MNNLSRKMVRRICRANNLFRLKKINIRCYSVINSWENDPEIGDFCFKKKSKPSELYILNKDVAKQLKNLIIKDLKLSLSGLDDNNITTDDNKNTIVAEINPGVGYLTKELLNNNIKLIHMYEEKIIFHKYLNEIILKYPKRLKLKPYNLVKLAKLQFIDNVTDQNNMGNIFQDVPKFKWKDKPSVIFIGAIPAINFFHFIQMSMTSQYLYNYGRFIFYVAILPSMSMILSGRNRRPRYLKPKNIYFQAMFDYKLLGTMSREFFYPLYTHKTKRNQSYHIDDDSLMHIVKLEARRDFFNDDFTHQDATNFFHFLQIHLRGKDSKIISSLEKWIPSCGLRLIKHNFNIYSKFTDLSSSQLLELFKIYKSWPEYKQNHTFINLVKEISDENL